MNATDLRARLREVLNGSPAATQPTAPADPRPEGHAGAAHVLGGRWHEAGDLKYFVVERRLPPSAPYGRERLGALAERLAAGAAGAALFAGPETRAPFVFFDLETTGLNGGAGTCAFLIGCAAFEPDGGLLTRQFVLTRQVDERQLLAALEAELAAAGTLVTFNGKSFDVPLIEMRYLFHRLPWTGRRLPHVDVLHPARRFWGEPAVACSLVALEQQVLGAWRTDDVPGFEIPSRYFEFVRTGNAVPLAPVLEHNRLDLVSLAALTARLLHLVRCGPAAARDGGEALALGQLYERNGFTDRAEEAYARAASGSKGRIEALRCLARLSRRARRHDEAAARWQALLETPACPPAIAAEASQALAIHHEHRARDLEAAHTFALRSLTGTDEGTAQRRAVQHRVARIERKIVSARLLPAASSPLPLAFGSPTSGHRTSS